jgi:hypothetical protein
MRNLYGRFASRGEETFENGWLKVCSRVDVKEELVLNFPVSVDYVRKRILKRVLLDLEKPSTASIYLRVY